MVDKTKQGPIPAQPKSGSPEVEKKGQPEQRSSDPTFIRGTIDPSTKKER